MLARREGRATCGATISAGSMRAPQLSAHLLVLPGRDSESCLSPTWARRPEAVRPPRREAVREKVEVLGSQAHLRAGPDSDPAKLKLLLLQTTSHSSV